MVLEFWGSEFHLLVFKMLFTFIFVTQLSRLLLGHNKDSTDGSNIRYVSIASTNACFALEIAG